MFRISTHQLAALCRRLAISTDAGIDDRRIWQREAERARGKMSRITSQISDAIQQGDSLSDAVAACSRYFPPLFRELTQLGEETGKQGAVYRRLADHYEHRLQLRRTFLAAITWPVIQLSLAILVVGFLIWVLGIIETNFGDAPYDILGLGLRGTSGLITYIGVVASAMALIAGLVFLVRSGAAWTGPVQQALTTIPVVGSCIKILALSRFAWSLGMTVEAGMNLKRAIPLAMGSTRNHYFSKHTAAAVSAIDDGETLYDALARTGAFPIDFMDALEVGEESGNLDEYLLLLADQYQDRAKSALAKLATLGGFLVWALVAVLIISMIVRMVAGYTGFLQDLTRP